MWSEGRTKAKADQWDCVAWGYVGEVQRGVSQRMRQECSGEFSRGENLASRFSLCLSSCSLEITLCMTHKARLALHLDRT